MERSNISKKLSSEIVIEDIYSMPEHTRSSFLKTLDSASVRAGLVVIGITTFPPGKCDPGLNKRAGPFDSMY